MDLMLARFDQAHHPYVKFFIVLQLNDPHSLRLQLPVIVLADEDPEPVVDAYLLDLRACGNEWLDAKRYYPEYADWVSADYFFAYYDAHKRRGWIQPSNEETRRGLSRRHEGKILIDPFTQRRLLTQPTQQVQS